MSNRNLEEARHYHTATKHSYTSVRAKTHYLDWQNKPALYKIYPEVDLFPLPTDFPKPEGDTLTALQTFAVPPEQNTPVTLSKLAQILFFAAGLTKKRDYPGGAYHFRAAPCAGALYPIEIYLEVSEAIDALPPGLYHFSPKHFGLGCLRKGEHKGVLYQATAGHAAIHAAPVTFIFTGIYWRSAWKYQSRAYRYCFWDSGAIAAHVLALAAALSVSACVVTGFVDSMIERLLGIDKKREGGLFCIPVGHSSSLPLPVEHEQIPSLTVKALSLSPEEVEYPLIARLHTASSLETPEEVRTWRSNPLPLRTAEQNDLISLRPLPVPERPVAPLGEVILKRGSARRFLLKSISFSQLSTLLDTVTQGIPADFLQKKKSSLLDLYLISNAVEGLPAGAYYFHPAKPGLYSLKKGNFREEAGYLCLEQPLGATASVVFFWLTNFGDLLEGFGNRGYRVAQLEAGITGGKLYLASYALGLGATGLTFYDDDVVNFFSPHAEGKIPLFVVAIGVPAPIRSSKIVQLRPDQMVGTF